MKRTSKTSVVALCHSSSELAKLVREKKDVKAELEKSAKSLLQLMDRQDDLTQYRKSVEQTKIDIKELSSQITTFVNIWNSVSTCHRGICSNSPDLRLHLLAAQA